MQSMMIWFVGVAVLMAAWGITDAIQALVKELRRANDLREAEKAVKADTHPAGSGQGANAQ